MDYNLFCQAQDLVDQLKPIAVAIDKAQSDTTGISDASKIFMDLQDDLTKIKFSFVSQRVSSHATWLHTSCILDTEDMDYQQNKESQI